MPLSQNLAVWMWSTSVLGTNSEPPADVLRAALTNKLIRGAYFNGGEISTSPVEQRIERSRNDCGMIC